MIGLLKKSAVYAFAIISVVFTFVSEAAFGAFGVIPESILQVFGDNSSEVNIILNRFLLFVIMWALTLVGYKVYLLCRNKISIKGSNYKITVEYGDLCKTKKCKKVIPFDECFSTQIGNLPSEIKETSICGQYLNANPALEIHSLIEKSQLKPLKSKSKYNHQERFESGRIVPNGDDLLLAFAKLDESGLGRLSRDEYLESLSILWKEINKYYGQKDVCIPILGSGLTRIEGGSGASLSQQELLDMIIWSYKLSSHKIKKPHRLRVICKRQEDFSLDKIDSQA